MFYHIWANNNFLYYYCKILILELILFIYYYVLSRLLEDMNGEQVKQSLVKSLRDEEGLVTDNCQKVLVILFMKLFLYMLHRTGTI